MSETKALAVTGSSSNVEFYRASTDAATMCRDIVVNTATKIQGRKYVQVEGWQAIAIAHGCSASARDVERIDGGVRAIGEVRRMSDGMVIAEAEGFVGEDESTWYGGTNQYGKTLPKRPDYAIRAMAQTRAISRACRSAFAHVVVMMNAGLSTTPAEEVPEGGFSNVIEGEVIQDAPSRRKAAADTSDVITKALAKIGGFVRVDDLTTWWKGQQNGLKEFLPAEDYAQLVEAARIKKDALKKADQDSNPFDEVA